MILQWSAASWTLVPTPAVANGQGYLNGAWCLNPHSCYAVGQQGKAAGSYLHDQLLMEHWNGTIWKRVSLPTVYSALLNSVACYKTFCMAVGGHLGHPLALEKPAV